MADEYLDIVNESDEVIGKETRKKAHAEGLLHREIHVWFVKPDTKEIVFQHRSPQKETCPDMLDPTVGGHVDSGDKYEDTAVREILEETGITVQREDLIFLRKVKLRATRPETGVTNYAFKSEFAYIFKGEVADLKIETGEAVNFEAWNIDAFLDLRDEQKTRFSPWLFKPEIVEMVKEMRAKLFV